jgi:hypothetical protein
MHGPGVVPWPTVARFPAGVEAQILGSRPGPGAIVAADGPFSSRQAVRSACKRMIFFGFFSARNAV